MKKEYVDRLIQAGRITVAALVIGICAAFFLYEPIRTAKFWFGGKSLLELLPGIVTACTASIAAAFTGLTYVASRQNVIADRYEKGVAMLESESDTRCAAGISILQSLAISRPGSIYETWVREIFAAAIEEWSVVAVQAVKPGGTLEDFPSTTVPIAKCVNALLRLPRPASERLVLSRALFSKSSFAGDFFGMRITGAVFAQATFQRASFEKAQVNGRIVEELSFGDCSLKQAYVRGHATDPADVDFSSCDLTGANLYFGHKAEVFYTDCNLDGAVIRGRVNLTNCWFENRPPTFTTHLVVDATSTRIFQRNADGEVALSVAAVVAKRLEKDHLVSSLTS